LQDQDLRLAAIKREAERIAVERRAAAAAAAAATTAGAGAGDDSSLPSATAASSNAAKPAAAATSPQSYQLTPDKPKAKKVASAENYDISNIHSDDSTDDEDEPRKVVPAWAQGSQLKAALYRQFRDPRQDDDETPPNPEQIFPEISPPNLANIFSTTFKERWVGMGECECVPTT